MVTTTPFFPLSDDSFKEGVVDKSGITNVAWNLVMASLTVLSELRTERNRRHWSVTKEHEDEVEPPIPVVPLLPLVVVEEEWGVDLDDVWGWSEPALSFELALVPLAVAPVPVPVAPSNPSSSSSKSYSS